MSKLEVSTNGLNTNLLAQAAQKHPRFTKLFAGLSKLDDFVKQVAEETINNNAGNPSAYYIKTEISAQCYSLYLYNTERQATIGTIWPIGDFLTQCETKSIEFDTRTRVKKMIREFGERTLDTGGKVHWIS